MKSVILLSAIIHLFLLNLASAQKVECQVSVQLRPILQQPTIQEELTDLDQRLMEYVNRKSWSDEFQDIIVNCSIQFILETFNESGSGKIYRSQFLISSPSGENFYDQAFDFPYVPGQTFETYRTTFDPLLDLVDYYVFMVIAGELDTYELFAGNPFYDRAQDIANQGQLSNYSTGWSRRLDEVILITDANHVPLREAKFYYYEGLYFVERDPNPQYARQFAAAVVERLKQVHNKRPNSRALKRFLDAHYQEICALFRSDLNRDNLETMIEIDPRHRDTYNDCTGGL